MQEQTLSQKQFKLIQKTYGLLQGTFVFLIVCAVLIAVSAIASLAFITEIMPDYPSLFLSFVPFIIDLIVFYLLVFSKHVFRKMILSASLLIYAVLSSAIGIYDRLFTGNPENMLLSSVISGVLFVAASAIFIYLAVLLLQKTREKQVRMIATKPLFISYIVLTYVSLCMSIFSLNSLITIDNNMAIIIIIVAIVAGLLSILFLLPQFVLYKGLSDEVFYQNFIVVYPLLVINQYQALKANRMIQSNGSGYCTKCGAPFRPDAAFCTVCGTKKAS